MSLMCSRLAAPFATILMVAAGVGTSSAHDVWLTTAGGANARRVIVNYGHPGDRPPALADKVVDLFAIGKERQTALLDGLAVARVHGAVVAASRPFVDDRRMLLAARYDNGFWVKVDEKTYRNATRRLVPQAQDSLWSGKFAKAVTGAGAPWDRILGHEIEIVPLGNPAALAPGARLRVRVLFRGQPLVGALVERGDGTTRMREDDIPKFKTDAEGVATIPLQRSGPTLLVVDHRVTPSATPGQASVDLYTATFWFSRGRSRLGRSRGQTR
jgi:uncharacterized GH25 family protein